MTSMEIEQVASLAHVTSQDLCIPELGPAKHKSPKRHGKFVNDSEGVLVYISREGFNLHKDGPLCLEEAGPREKLFFDPNKTKCAIVTCGGLCPGINDVIRAIVMEAHHNYNVAATLGIRYGLSGFIPSYHLDVMELTPGNVANIHQFGGTILGSSRGPQPACDIVDALERMNINIVFIIGGVGAMRAAAKIKAEIDARGLTLGVVCIPKTIDNDINFVSRTFGFNSAVEKATQAISCAHAEATGGPNGIGLVKLMGRESGFIAAEATLGLKEVNFVLIPEYAFELDGPSGLLAALEERLTKRGHAVIVAAEGAGQHLLPGTGLKDPSGNPVLGDFCGLLIKRINAHFKAKSLPLTFKFIDPSYIIRSVPANTQDRVYCGFLGQNAVHAAMAGKTGLMLSTWHNRTVHVPLHLVIGGRKKLDVHSNYWRAVLDSTGQPELTNPKPEAAAQA